MKILVCGEPYEVLVKEGGEAALVVEVNGAQFRYLLDCWERERDGTVKVARLCFWVGQAVMDYQSTHEPKEHPFFQTPFYRQRCLMCTREFRFRGGVNKCVFCGGPMSRDLEPSNYTNEGDHYDD